MAESSESDNDRSSLWSALSLLRNGQTDSNSSSGGTPTVPEHQPPPQVPNSSSVPATTTTVFSTSVFGLSQSMDIMNSATDFSVVFSPPPRIVPQEDPSSSGATPQEEESTHQQQHGMHVPEVAETDPILAMEVGREDDGVEERRDGNDKSMEESTREREIEEQERDVHVPAEEEADQASNIEELMETSRRNIIPMEERRIAEEKRRRELLLEQSKLFKTVRVPGELSTASDTMSSEGEGFIEPSNYLMKRRVCPGDVDQVTPLATHLSQFPSTSRDAALSMTDTTESEPEVVPGSKQTKEDKRPRKVPQQKRTSRDLRQDGGEENGSFRTTGSMTMRTSTGEGQVSDGRGTVPMNRDTTPPLPSSDGHDTALAPPLPSTSPPEQGFSSSQPSSSSSHSDTTELPPSTSQSSGSRSSDGSSITTTTSSSGSVLEVSGLTASSQGTDVQSVSSQTPALPLFSSTPNETDLDETVVVTTTDSDHPLMPPPLHPPMKHSSTDISTSSSGTSGYLYKNKGVVRLTGGGGDEETATAGIPTSGSTESLPSTPLAPATPTNDRSMEITNDVIPATPLSDVMESARGGTVELAPSQDDLFQDTHPDSQFEVDNQLPKWMTRSPHQQHQGQQQTVKEGTGSSNDDHSGPSVISSKRPLLDSSSSSSSDSGMPGPSYSPSKPPPKRQRMSATPSTPDFNEPPKWMKQQMKSGLYHSTPSGNIAPPTETESSLTLSSAGSSPNKSSQSPMISATSSSLGSSGRSLSSGYLAGSSSIGSSGFTPPGSIVRESSSFTSTSVTQSGLVVNKMAASVDTVEKSKVNVGSEDATPDNTNNNNGSGQGTVESEGESGDVGKGGCKSGAEEGDSGDRRDGDGGGMVAMVSSSFSPECDGTAGHDADVSAVTGETSSNNNTPPLPLVASAGKESKETCSSNDTMANKSNEAAMNSNEGREELRQESKSQTVGEADPPCGTDKNDALHVQKADHCLRRDPLVEEMEVEESGNGMPASTDQKDSEVDSTQMSFVLQLSLSQSEGAVSPFKPSIPPDPNANCNKTSMLPSQQTQDVIDLTSSISETMEFAVTQETETAPETDSAPSTPHNPQSPSTNEDTIDLTSPNVISSSHTHSQPDNSKGCTDVAVPISLKQSEGINSQSQGNLGSNIPPSEEMFTPPTPPHATSPKPSARPTYESVCYSSVDELQETPPLPERHSGSVADEGKDNKQSKTAESPDSNQYSSSGTPFQFNLPAGNSILRPFSRITPPSQLHSSSSSAVMVEAGTGEPENHTHTPDKLTDGQRNVEAHSDDQVPSSSSSKELLPPSNKVPRLELDPQDTTTTTSKEDLVAIEKESNSSGTKNISSSLSKHGNGRQPMVETPVSSSNLPSGGVAPETEVQMESVANGRPKDDQMPPVTLAPFVIGDMRDGEEGENLDDSQTYVMPEISGMEDSEQDSVSTFNFCLRRPPPSQTEGVSQLHVPVSSIPQKQPSTHTQGNLSGSVIGIGLRTEDQTESEDISEDPFEFNSKTHVVMPIRRRRMPQAVSIISNNRIAPSVPAVSSSVTGRSTPLAPVCSTDVIVNPVTNTCTSASGGTCTLTQASGFVQVAPQGGLPGTPQTPSPQTPSPNAPMVITTPTNYQASNFIPMQYSTPPHPFPTVSTPTAVNQSQSSSNRSFEASSHHTPISFSSPSGFVQPHAIQSLCSGAQYVRLHHIRTVTTVRKFVSTEIIDRSTGSVLHSGFGEIESPQEQQQVSLQAEPLASLPPGVSGSFSSSFAATPPPVSSLDNTSPTDQYLSSVPVTGIKHVPPTSSFCFTPQLVNPPCSTGFLIPETPPTPTSLPLQATCSSRNLLSSSQPPSPSSSRTSAPSPIMKTTLGHFDLKPGMRVVAKWRDNNWYAATVRKKTAKRVSLAFMDGDNDSAAVQYVLPLSLLPCGTSVFALEDEDSEDSTSSEQFGSFLEVDGQMFKMEIDSGTVTSCDLKRLMLTAEAGQMATKVALSSGRGDTSSVMKFFSGYVFLLTDQKKETPAMASGTGEAGYVKRETIEEMIKSRGGIIMDDYKASKVLEKKTFCLSNTYCRTVKYLIALAINIPCVSYEWVKECLKQNKFVSYQSFILPAGVSTVSKEVVNWSPRPKRFFQCTVYIHGDKAFKDFWEKVCSAGGAKILSRPPSKTKVAGQINIVIESNRSTVPQSIRDLRGIVHLVTSDWLVESFLQGAIADTKDFEV